MKYIFFFICFLQVAAAADNLNNYLSNSKNLPPEPKMPLLKETDSFYDEKVNYSKFIGRVTDRDDVNDIVKVKSDDLNSKFFHTGDRLEFIVGNRKQFKKPCEGFVRGVEPGYFVMFISELNMCYKNRHYLRRGTILNFSSADLEKRVREASIHRQLLIQRREDFFGQLNGINHFLWTFDQQRVQLALDYDKKLIDLERAKERAVDSFLMKKKDQMKLQKALIKRIDELNETIDHFRVERTAGFDRWSHDLELGIPVKNRPQKVKSH